MEDRSVSIPEEWPGPPMEQLDILGNVPFYIPQPLESELDL